MKPKRKLEHRAMNWGVIARKCWDRGHEMGGNKSTRKGGTL